jgi:hypothetical protein
LTSPFVLARVYESPGGGHLAKRTNPSRADAEFQVFLFRNDLSDKLRGVILLLLSGVSIFCILVRITLSKIVVAELRYVLALRNSVDLRISDPTELYLLQILILETVFGPIKSMPR